MDPMRLVPSVVQSMDGPGATAALLSSVFVAEDARPIRIRPPQASTAADVDEDGPSPSPHAQATHPNNTFSLLLQCRKEVQQRATNSKDAGYVVSHPSPSLDLIPIERKKHMRVLFDAKYLTLINTLVMN